MSDFFRADAADLAEDAKQLLIELDQDTPGAASVNGECRPPLDVLETAEAIEVVVDVPGMPADSMRVAIRRSTLLVVGAKVPVASAQGARFHLAERAYGRFARAVRLTAAVDPKRATAVVASGQLRVVLPRIADRRGHIIKVAVTRA